MKKTTLIAGITGQKNNSFECLILNFELGEYKNDK